MHWAHSRGVVKAKRQAHGVILLIRGASVADIGSDSSSYSKKNRFGPKGSMTLVKPLCHCYGGMWHVAVICANAALSGPSVAVGYTRLFVWWVISLTM